MFSEYHSVPGAVPSQKWNLKVRRLWAVTVSPDLFHVPPDRFLQSSGTADTVLGLLQDIIDETSMTLNARAT